MPPPINRCPVYHFRPRISHRDASRLDSDQYGITLPEGVSPGHVREPTFVTPQRMLSLLRNRNRGSDGGGLGVVHGLTRADFSLGFPDMDRQWRAERNDAGFTSWVFQGGDVYLEIALEVFVLEGDRPGSDAPSRRIFGIIMEHELEHVADEIDLVSHWMPTHAPRDRLVRRFLTDGQPMDGREFRHWFQTGHFERWLENSLWAPEHNRRQARRDSPDNYRALQERIDRERRRQTNRR